MLFAVLIDFPLAAQASVVTMPGGPRMGLAGALFLAAFIAR